MKKLIDNLLTQQIRDLWSYKGEKPEVIALKVGVSESTVRRTIKEWDMQTPKELAFYIDVIEFLLSQGKVSKENKYRNGQFYPFDLTDDDVVAIATELTNQLKLQGKENDIELADYYKKLVKGIKS